MTRISLLLILFSLLSPSIVFGGSRLEPFIVYGDEVDGWHDNHFAQKLLSSAIQRLQTVVPRSHALRDEGIRGEVSEILKTGIFNLEVGDHIEGEVDSDLCYRTRDNGDRYRVQFDYIRKTRKMGSHFDFNGASNGHRIVICPKFYDLENRLTDMSFEIRVSNSAYALMHEVGHPFGFHTPGGAADDLASRVICEFPGVFEEVCVSSSVYVNLDDIPEVEVLWNVSSDLNLPSLSVQATTNKIQRNLKPDFLMYLDDIVAGFDTDARPVRGTLLKKFTEIRHSQRKATQTLSIDALTVELDRADLNAAGSCKVTMKVSVLNNRPVEYQDRKEASIKIKPFEKCLEARLEKADFLQLINSVFAKINSAESMGRTFKVNISPELPNPVVSSPAGEAVNRRIQSYIRRSLQPAVDDWLFGHDSPFWDVIGSYSNSKDSPLDHFQVDLAGASVQVTDSDIQVGLRYQFRGADGELVDLDSSGGEADFWEVSESVEISLRDEEILAEEASNHIFLLYTRTAEEAAMFASGRACEYTLDRSGKRFSNTTVRSLRDLESFEVYIARLHSNSTRLEKRMLRECQKDLHKTAEALGSSIFENFLVEKPRL